MDRGLHSSKILQEARTESARHSHQSSQMWKGKGPTMTKHQQVSQTITFRRQRLFLQQRLKVLLAGILKKCVGKEWNGERGDSLTCHPEFTTCELYLETSLLIYLEHLARVFTILIKTTFNSCMLFSLWIFG